MHRTPIAVIAMASALPRGVPLRTVAAAHAMSHLMLTVPVLPGGCGRVVGIGSGRGPPVLMAGIGQQRCAGQSRDRKGGTHQKRFHHRLLKVKYVV